MENKFFSKYNENGYYPQYMTANPLPTLDPTGLSVFIRITAELKTMYEIFFDKNEGGIELPNHWFG